MKVRLPICLFMLAFFALPMALIANDDIHIEICHETKYLNCMEIDSNACLQAHKKANKFCETKFPYTIESNEEELRATAKKYGACVTNNYISNLGSNTNKFEKCGIYLEPIFNANYNNALKKSKEFDEKFFEEDDPLHQY